MLFLILSSPVLFRASWLLAVAAGHGGVARRRRVADVMTLLSERRARTAAPFSSGLSPAERCGGLAGNANREA
jgi:hypothetical protein